MCLLECGTKTYILKYISTLFVMGRRWREMKKLDYSDNSYQNPTKTPSVESSFAMHLTKKKKILQNSISSGFYA